MYVGNPIMMHTISIAIATSGQVTPNVITPININKVVIMIGMINALRSAIANPNNTATNGFMFLLSILTPLCNIL